LPKGIRHGTNLLRKQIRRDKIITRIFSDNLTKRIVQKTEGVYF